MTSSPKDYGEFWPYYLREHAKPATRRLHFFGTALALALLAAAAVLADWRVLLAAIVCGYLFAWVGHFSIEHNRPATFRYPLWSLLSDFRMFFLWVAGRLDEHLKRAGVA